MCPGRARLRSFWHGGSRGGFELDTGRDHDHGRRSRGARLVVPRLLQVGLRHRRHQTFGGFRPTSGAPASSPSRPSWSSSQWPRAILVRPTRFGKVKLPAPAFDLAMGADRPDPRIRRDGVRPGVPPRRPACRCRPRHRLLGRAIGCIATLVGAVLLQRARVGALRCLGAAPGCLTHRNRSGGADMTETVEPARPGTAPRLGWRVERRPRPGLRPRARRGGGRVPGRRRHRVRGRGRQRRPHHARRGVQPDPDRGRTRGRDPRAGTAAVGVRHRHRARRSARCGSSGSSAAATRAAARSAGSTC